MVKSYAESYAVLCGGKSEPVHPRYIPRAGSFAVFGPGPHLSRMRSLMTTKTKMRTGGLRTTKAMYQDFPNTCTKTFTCGKSWYGSYARFGFSAKSLMRVLCGFFLDGFFFRYDTVPNLCISLCTKRSMATGQDLPLTVALRRYWLTHRRSC